MSNFGSPRRRSVGKPHGGQMPQPPPGTVPIVLRLPVLAVALLAAMVSGCSTKSAEQTSQQGPGSVSTTTTAGTTLMVDGHTHTISGPVTCKPSEANPTGTPPHGDTEISAGDGTASFVLSWLSGATPPLLGMTFVLKVDNGEYTTPWVPNPTAEATQEGKSYAVKGTAAVTPPGQSAVKNVPFEIHATCP